MNLVLATSQCIVYDDGKPLSNRTSSLVTVVLPPELEYAPDRGGVVFKGHRIKASQAWRYVRDLGMTFGEFAGSYYGLREQDVKVAVEFCDAHSEFIEPEDDLDWWLDSEE